MVLIKSDLEKYKISSEDADKAHEDGTLYELINTSRHDFFAEEYRESAKFVEEAKEMHNDAQELLHAIKTKNTEIAIQKLKNYNIGAGSGTVKVLVMVDATASMGVLLHKAKNTVGTMCNRISDILEDKGVDPRCFQLQFAAYRNYNAPAEELLRCSGWCGNSGELRQFLAGVEASYGWGNEAVEVALDYAKRLIEKHDDDVNEMILIGDAGCNTVEQIKEKRRQRKEKYWLKTEFANVKHYQDSLATFESLEIPIHCFYLHERAKNDFENISEQTYGICESLNVNDAKRSSETLTKIVSERVLNAAGGDEFVKAYREKYSAVMHTS